MTWSMMSTILGFVFMAIGMVLFTWGFAVDEMPKWGAALLIIGSSMVCASALMR